MLCLVRDDLCLANHLRVVFWFGTVRARRLWFNEPRFATRTGANLGLSMAVPTGMEF